MVKNKVTYADWKAELIKVTARETGMREDEVSINDVGAREWYKDGMTPYFTFRETFSNEDDCGA